ncbi:FAD-dependent oxidoreductase [Vreelandella maris]|jgi:glycine/D-amino acid oxidase-like deaminating enzyme|uniref:NAD(P)/FAD-dependent oxidoreductase n=1 Tax=Vreelandella maris TaxID=2729617 RepID=UPI0030EC53C0
MPTTLSERCLWPQMSAETPLDYPALARHEEVDVCVVGGGITGLSTALHLAEKGIKTALLEAGDIPSGGSGRNVGLVNAGLWIPPMTLWPR